MVIIRDRIYILQFRPMKVKFQTFVPDVTKPSSKCYIGYAGFRLIVVQPLHLHDRFPEV